MTKAGADERVAGASLDRRGGRQALELPSVEGGRLREVAGTFATGVTIVTTQTGSRLFGCTANAVTSLSLDPPLMLVCLDRSTNTHPHLLEARAFAINVIRQEEGAEELCRLFAGKAQDKFADVDWRPGVTGSPILHASLAHLECELDATYEGGDHTIFVGRVVAAERGEGEPIVFYRGSFTTLEPPPA
jgi:4-nitrophenol 2-monooxygenase / 4-nitrocatechol 4-monooxygenase, reductase component